MTKPTSVLVVRLSAIGDVIHALPVLDALRDQLPGARIGWLVEELSAPLLENHPALDRVYTIPRRRWRGKFRAMYRSEIRPFFRAVREEGWDASLDLQGITKGGLAAWACGARTRVGFAGPNSREVDFLFNNRRVRPEASDVHVTQQNLRLLEGLGLEVPRVPPRGRIGIRDAEREATGASLNGVGWKGEPLLAVNPGAGFASKRWAPARFAELARLIAARSGLRPIVLWGPKEEPMRDEIVSLLARERAFAAPPTSVREMASLISLCKFFIGSDTGPSHLAGLFRVPVLTLFGGTDAQRNHPWTGGAADQLAIQRDDLACVPCWERTCPLKGDAHMACLTGLSPRDVYTRAEPWLATVLP